MRFGSKRAGFRRDARGAEPIRHATNGDIIGIQKPLVAEFAIFGESFTPYGDDGEPIRNPDGTPYLSANIRGNFFDSERAQEDLGWTDEEREMVERALLWTCRTHPAEVWIIEDIPLSAPWPRFDTQDDVEAIATAVATGQVSEALAYAKQENREKVVAELEAVVAEQAEAEQAEAALTVA